MVDLKMIACVADVPVRAKCCVSRASEDSGRAVPFLLSRPESSLACDTQHFARTRTLATQAMKMTEKF